MACPFCDGEVAAGVPRCPSCGRDPRLARRLCPSCRRWTPVKERACCHCRVKFKSELRWKVPLIILIIALASALGALLQVWMR